MRPLSEFQPTILWLRGMCLNMRILGRKLWVEKEEQEKGDKLRGRNRISLYSSSFSCISPVFYFSQVTSQVRNGKNAERQI